MYLFLDTVFNVFGYLNYFSNLLYYIYPGRLGVQINQFKKIVAQEGERSENVIQPLFFGRQFS